MTRFIGLTGRDNQPMCDVAHHLLETITAKGLPIAVLIGVSTIEEANLIYTDAGELWRIGYDLTRPHLDHLVDRQIETATDHLAMLAQVDHCLGLFLGKLQVAG